MHVDLTVRITGRDVSGDHFTQSVIASSISRSGALLSGITREMRFGDPVWIEYQDKKARFRVVWAKSSPSEQKSQAAIHSRASGPDRLENMECPWGS